MQALVIGAGWMGTAIAYGMCKQGFNVSLCDYPERLNEARDKLTALNCTTLEKWGLIHKDDLEDTPLSPDIVISSAPFYANPNIARICKDRKWRYCDLGGNPEVSLEVQFYGTPEAPVFTDLGLAPGYANILAEELYRRSPVAHEELDICVGGLPVYPYGQLNYNLVFNVNGLHNEYTGDVELLVNGEIKTVKALSQVMDISQERSLGFGMPPLEAAYTKGGLSTTLESMKNRGVKNAQYRTYRHKGHFAIIKYLLEDVRMSRDEFTYLIERSCPPTKQDLVLIKVALSGVGFHEGKVSITEKILHDENWTAMQKATAFPTAAIAAIMATGQLDGKAVLTYEDVPFETLQANLKTIGFERKTNWV